MLFVGGPGRSGTSVFAQQLIEHTHIVGFFDVELKIYSEIDGLIDLHNSFGPNFGPNRAEMALRRLSFLFDALFQGASDQAPLLRFVEKAEVKALIDVLRTRLGFPHNLRRLDDPAFFSAAGAFSQGLADLARRRLDRLGATVFLEKTPHVLLHLPFLRKLHPDAAFIHVMRDPRSVAHSLMRMPWGPSELDDCISWVDGYWSAYRESRHWAHVNHVRVLELLIEKVTVTPDKATQLVCDMLEIPVVPNLFPWGEISRLNDWVEKATAENLNRLNSRLGDLATKIGYRADAIGVPAV